MNQEKVNLFSRSSILIAFLLSIAYLLLSYFLIPFKTDQLVLIAIFNTCFFFYRPSPENLSSDFPFL